MEVTLPEGVRMGYYIVGLLVAALVLVGVIRLAIRRGGDRDLTHRDPRDLSRGGSRGNGTSASTEFATKRSGGTVGPVG